MSTYYYMVCDRCRERVACASRIASGDWVGLSIKDSPDAGNALSVWRFLGRHRGCVGYHCGDELTDGVRHVRLSYEHEDAIYEYRELTAAECAEPLETS